MPSLDVPSHSTMSPETNNYTQKEPYTSNILVKSGKFVVVQTLPENRNKKRYAEDEPSRNWGGVCEDLQKGRISPRYLPPRIDQQHFSRDSQMVSLEC